MKNIKTILKLTGLCASAAFTVICLLAGCFSAIDDSVSGAGIPDGKGAVLLNIGESGGRTAFPAMTGITYTITCVMGGTEQTASASRNTFTIELAPGTWNIKVEAKNSGDDTIAEGTTEVLVKQGKTTEASVLLTAIEPVGAETGTLVWSADFPTGLGSAAIAYSGTADGTVDLLDSGITVVGTKRSGELALKPGVYTVTVNLANGSKKAGDVAVVYIYNGLRTTVNWTFTADSLVEFNPLALSVDINASAGITVSGAALTLSGNGGMVAQELEFAKNTGSAWKVTTSIPETATTLNWSLVVTTERGALPAVTGSGAAAPSITLNTVDIYTLTASVGANGGLKAGSTDMANGDVLEFLGGTSVTLTAAPDGGYELDSMTVGGSPVSSPYVINANTVINVTFKEKTGVDTNLIFEWEYKSPADAPQGTFTNTGTNAYLVGTGIHSQAANMPITAMNNTVTHVSGKGIQIDGNASTAILLIGINGSDARTATTSSTAPDGVFNFTENNAGYKVTIKLAEAPTAAGSGRSLSVNLCHNNTTGNNGPFGGAYSPANAGRLYYDQTPWNSASTSKPDTGLTVSGNNGAWDTATNTITLRNIVPSITNFPTNRSFLEKGWIAITQLGTNSGNAGATFIINYIKIEKL